jgi:hypothetical protein
MNRSVAAALALFGVVLPACKRTSFSARFQEVSFGQVKKGMRIAEVIGLLGSPLLVTKSRKLPSGVLMRVETFRPESAELVISLVESSADVVTLDYSEQINVNLGYERRSIRFEDHVVTELTKSFVDE